MLRAIAQYAGRQRREAELAELAKPVVVPPVPVPAWRRFAFLSSLFRRR